MKRFDIPIIILLVCLAVGVAWAAGGVSVLSEGEVDNSETYYGNEKTVSADTSEVNEWVITAIGPVHAVVKLRVYAGGRWSGYQRIDSFQTTRGTIRHITAITNDSLMRIWLPPFDAPADTNKLPAYSLLKKTAGFFKAQIYIETMAANNSGSVNVTWIE